MHLSFTPENADISDVIIESSDVDEEYLSIVSISEDKKDIVIKAGTPTQEVVVTLYAYAGEGESYIEADLQITITT